MYSQTEHYTAMVVNMQCKYMSFFTCKNQTSKLDKENIEWPIKKNNLENLATYKTKKKKTKTQDILDTTMRTQTQLT